MCYIYHQHTTNMATLSRDYKQEYSNKNRSSV